MSDAVKTFKFADGAVLEIIRDDDPMNPRKEFDNLCTMVCFHNNYELGDKHDYRKDDFESLAELKEQIEKDNNVVLIAPLYLYEHGGITISMGSFSCPWDSGQVGWIYLPREKLHELGGNEDELVRAERCMKAEVETYDQYLTGEVYGYVFKLPPPLPCPCCGRSFESEVEGSCWGFFGDPDDVVGEADIPEKYRDMILSEQFETA